MKVLRMEGADVVCQAQNASELSGLLTVLHGGDEASGGGLNLTDLPLLSRTDVAALKCAEYCSDGPPPGRHSHLPTGTAPTGLGSRVLRLQLQRQHSYRVSAPTSVCVATTYAHVRTCTR